MQKIFKKYESKHEKELNPEVNLFRALFHHIVHKRNVKALRIEKWNGFNNACTAD